MDHDLQRTVSNDSVKSRSSTSHLLTISAPSSASIASRKGRNVEPGTSAGHVGRASVSMPPPASKSIPRQYPSRRPSKASVTGVTEIGSVPENPQHGAAGPAADADTTPTLEGTQPLTGTTLLALPDAAIPTSRNSTDLESNRMSFSSLYSVGSAIYNAARGTSGPSSVAGSEPEGRSDVHAHPTTHFLTPQDQPSSLSSHSPSSPQLHHGAGHSRTKLHRSRSRTIEQRRISGSTGASSSSPGSRDMRDHDRRPIGVIGVCALDAKARSKPSRNILNRLISHGEFEVKIFGDKVILDEDVENWPVCDFLISFFSDGFPLDKAISYARLRKPFCVNDLPMQTVLWDRRLCLLILDKLGVPTPDRVEVNRDGGPVLASKETAQRLFDKTGVVLEGPEGGIGGGQAPPKSVELIDDGDAIKVDGKILKKPFVEKPVSGEDHNIHIYFPKSLGGGGRRLFRKINNKSSEHDETLEIPRCLTEPGSSYLYEDFLRVENAEDVKAYTVGPEFCHAETRKSPVVDGIVKRNPSGKEIRYKTKLTPEEMEMAAKIADGFGQRVCGFDMLRAGDRTYVIDVNGWSFVKDNNEYYDKSASILREIFSKEKMRKEGRASSMASSTPSTFNDDDHSHDAVKRPNRPRQSTQPTHRSGLNQIFKSPSLTRLSHLSQHARSAGSGTASPEIVQQPTPVGSPPNLEYASQAPVSSVRSAHEHELLPPPAVEDAHDVPADDEVSEDNATSPLPPPASKAQWKMKGMVSVIRHADRTPKQKFKFTFHTEPFVELLKGHQEEVLLTGEAALRSVEEAVKKAIKQGIEDPEKLRTLHTSLIRKGGQPGTKVQIKPMFRKRKKDEILPGMEPPSDNDTADLTRSSTTMSSAVDSIAKEGDPESAAKRSDSVSDGLLSRFAAAEGNLILDKLQLIIKWGGEPTHAARYQAQDLGENMRNDLLLMNREALDDVMVFSSSERRVTTSAQIFSASFLHQQDLPEGFISIRKDLLDDSNAAKDEMDKVKKKLKGLLREGDKAPAQFAWPSDLPEPFIVVRDVVELMRFHRKVMRHNYTKLQNDAAASLAAAASPGKNGNATSGASTGGSLSQAQAANSIQSRWCCGEGPELFKERWEKLFSEFCDSEKVDPSKISELYDTMKFDALHNRQFLEWAFTPDAFFDSGEAVVSDAASDSVMLDPKWSNTVPSLEALVEAKEPVPTKKVSSERFKLGERMGLRRKSEALTSTTKTHAYDHPHESYFALYRGVGNAAVSRAKVDARLAKLRELYKYCKVLFDYIGPQEYGITNNEKLEIGLLTSLPLLKEIVRDLEDVQASEGAKSFFYFTKESHIYTLLNCILEGGIKTKIQRNAIPELDYLSQICFELYESENPTLEDEPNSFNYSIRITISPGCHTFDPLDVQLDSKHSIGISPRRSLTAHHDWKEIIETLRAKFHTVNLPKSFVAVNLSEKVPHAFNLPSEPSDTDDLNMDD